MFKFVLSVNCCFDKKTKTLKQKSVQYLVALLLFEIIVLLFFFLFFPLSVLIDKYIFSYLCRIQGF